MPKYLPIVVFIAFLTACGGSSGPGVVDPGSAEVQGLTLPENFSILSAQDGGNQTQEARLEARVTSSLAAVTPDAGSYDDPGTDYTGDEVHVYVDDESMDALNLVNEILCYMSQSGASEMVNEGAYIALINEDRCRQGQNQSASGETGQSSSAGAVEYVRWVIESARADNASPQIVHLWVPDSGDRDPNQPEENILVEMTVHEGVSAQQPFGQFVMNFRGVTDGAFFNQAAGTEVEMMRGTLQTVENAFGKPQFRLLSVGGDAMEMGLNAGFGFSQAANVRLDDAAGTSGVARTSTYDTWTFQGQFGPETGSREEEFTIAYDDGHFLSNRDDDNDGIADEQFCRARDQFDTRVWRYNLYHETAGTFRNAATAVGERVELFSGFPFTWDADDDGVDESQGWLGYHGIWTESDVALDDGLVVRNYDYDNDTAVPYTVRVSPGKLIRRTASQAPLTDFTGREFQGWFPHPTFGIGDNWLVTVTGDHRFRIVGAMTWGEQGPEITENVDHDQNPATDPVPAAVTFLPGNFETLHLWSDELGGSVVYTHDDTVAATARAVTLYASQNMGPDDAGLPATLYCYEGCLKGGLTQTDVDAATGAHELFHEYTGVPLTYTVAAADGRIVVTDDLDDSVVSAVDLDMSALGHDWGINSGEMLTTPLADPDQPWQVWNAATSFHWESGPNDWNTMVVAVDGSGAPVSFDQPLQFSYTHSVLADANDDASYDGERFFLSYQGPGDLHGFPWVEDGDTGRWNPGFVLDDGTVLDDGSNRFVVRAMEQEQTMREVDIADCGGLDADAVRSDSGLALPQLADIGTVNLTWANRPVLTTPPAVIEGVVQQSD